MDQEKIKELGARIDDSDAIVIGAGAGLSVSAGMTYSGRRFEENFSDFIAAYHFEDMYSGGFYPFPSPEEYWAYWSRYIFINRYQDAPKPVYQNLYRLVKDRDYFVLTTNVDHLFQKAGFEKHRLFYTQGDYGLWQCSIPCHPKTYDNEQAVLEMVRQQKDRRIPSSLIPCCPVCKKPMSMNLRMDHTFVEEEGWHMASDRYNAFLHRHRNKKILFLELGVGNNTPGIIKYPFWKMTYENPKAGYACINRGAAFAPAEIENRSVCIDGDIGSVLSCLEGA